MKVLVTDYTLEKAQAKAATAVDPTGLIAFARQAPDAQSRPQLQSTPQGRSRNSRQQQSLQARTRLAVHEGNAYLLTKVARGQVCFLLLSLAIWVAMC